MTNTTPVSDRLRFWHPRLMLCAVCIRPAAGFGFSDPHDKTRPRPRRWFCSMPCQNLFARITTKGLTMVEFTEEETQALPAVMVAMASIMEDIGWGRPLSELTRNDMHRLIVATIESFRIEMAAIAADAEIPF